MVDGLSAVASVATLIHVATQIGKWCDEYYRGVKEARKEIRSLSDEVTNLADVLKNLKELFEGPAGSRLASKKIWTQADNPLQACHHELDDIRKKLEPTKGAKLKWPFNKKDVAKLLVTLERRKSTLELQMIIDNTSVSLEANQGMSDVQETIASGRRDAQREKILQWLLSVDPSTNHNSAREKHDPETGQWFLQNEQFCKWITEPNSLLWLHGKAGCGKSILCSAIVDQVQKLVEAEANSVIAYFYFDFNDSDKQSVTNLIRSLCLQLCYPKKDLPLSVHDAYKKCMDGRPSLAVEDLHAILLASFSGFDHVYLIIDAIDECPIVDGNREKLLRSIWQIHDHKLNSLHFLMTSRRELDIEDGISPLLTGPVDASIDIQADIVKKDISRFVVNQIESSKFEKWPEKLKNEVKSSLIEGADGMFRWVALHLDQLHTISRPKLVSEALKGLPKTLDGTYDRMLANIEADVHDQVISALQLLSFSARPLSVTELAEAVVIKRNEQPSIDPENRYFQPSEILRLLPGLITVTTPASTPEGKFYNGEVKLAHYSVKEYLVSDRILRGPASGFQVLRNQAHLFITETCLSYLLYVADVDKPSSRKLFRETSCKAFPFLMYATCHWASHMKVIDDKPWDDCLNSLCLDFLKPAGESLLIRATIVLEGRLNYGSQQSNGIRLAQDNGNELLSLSNCSTELLVRTAKHGLLKATVLLLDSGVDVNSHHEYTENNRDFGADFHDSALYSASEQGHLQVVQLLLEKGADINRSAGRYVHALAAASLRGHLQIVQLLLEKGADINRSAGYHGHALAAASATGHLQVVQLLLEKGADINQSGGDFGHALAAASLWGRLQVVQLLMENGADVNQSAKNGDSALLTGVMSSNVDLVGFLLDHNANINCKGSHGNALETAFYRQGEVAKSRMLRDNEIPLNASHEGYNEIIKLLRAKMGSSAETVH